MRSAKVVTQEYDCAPSIWELESRGLLMTKESSGTQGCRKIGRMYKNKQMSSMKIEEQLGSFIEENRNLS
jgi:hypothetical protein